MEALLEQAIRSQNVALVKELLTKEPSAVDLTDKDGTPLLFLAASTGCEELVRYLVEYSRASLNLHGSDYRTILHYAVLSGNASLVRYLVERAGMSPTDGDANLITPYQLAYENHFTEITAYFEEICGAPYEKMYHNPIRTGMHPDPSIVRVGEDYYMVNSSFIYFPCIPVSHSKDLIHWEVIGHAITNPEWAGLNGLEGGRGYWAPDISYHKGRFYITATYRLNDTGTIYRKQMVTSSKHPEGPYCKPVFLDEDGIDPSLFTDDDGRRYMLLNRGARIFEVSEDATRKLSPATLLYYGDNKRAPEGPHLLKKDGYYYLFLAEGGTGPGHRITVARSKTLFGVYDPCPYNPIMREEDPAAPIQRCGHGKPVQTQNGEWFMVYLCGRTLNGAYSILGRETALDPITWTADGWPLVNNRKGPSALQKPPKLPAYEAPASLQELDHFDGDRLSYDWSFPRAPEADACFLKNSFLFLKASTFDLDSMAARNLLLKKQKHFAFTATTKLFLDNPLQPGQDMGLTCYYDENTYLKYGVFQTKAGMLLQVTETIGEERLTSFQTPLPPFSDLLLRIQVNGLSRSFSYSTDGSHFCEIGTKEEVTYLCDEGLKKGKRFTGAMVGLYAHRGGKDLPSYYARFDFFHYEAQPCCTP